MDLARVLPPLTACAILLVGLVSGPLVGAVDLSPEEDEWVPGDGDADVTVLSVPDGGRLDPTRYSTDGYRVVVSPATVRVSNLTGHPMVVYKVRIPELGYVGGSTHVFDAHHAGRQELTLGEPTLRRASLPNDTYRAELLVLEREHERETLLYRQNVTLRVRR